MDNRLYRSPTDKVIGGVAGGLAVWMRVDPSLVRIGWVLLAIFSGGIFVLVYFVMMLVVPLPPPGWVPPRPGLPGPGAVPGWDPGTGTWATTGSAPGAAPGGVPPDPTGQGAWATPAQPSPGQPGSWQAPRSSGWNAPGAGNVGVVAGVVLVLLGVWFLVDEFVNIDWGLLWPLVVVVLGIALIAAAVRRGRGG